MRILLVLSLCLYQYVNSEVADGQVGPRTHPPRFTIQPVKEQGYKVGDKTGSNVELRCEAEADPPASYRWYKDGQELDLLGNSHYTKLLGVGTLHISNPQDEHEGIYQCFASNEYGTAVSIRSQLKKAVLDPFDTTIDIPTHRPRVGDSLTLNCRPPRSYPTGVVYWGPGTGFDKIQTDERISQDYDGNLHFANIQADDDYDGDVLTCMVQNIVLRSVVKGNDQRIDPHGIAATIDYRAPAVMWTSDSPTVGIVDADMKMKCIFSGYPTPQVTWTRQGEAMPGKVQSTAGQELVIPRLQFSDTGIYRCTGTNLDQGGGPHRDFELIVESRPIWRVKPESVNAAVEENAEFRCEGGGSPEPHIEWSINGEPLTDDNPRREVLEGGHLIRYTNLSESDVQVLQCNASNKHGYIFENVFLNVAADPPAFQEFPDSLTKVAMGQSVNMTCRAYGAPKPVITWYLNDTKVSGNRFTQMKNGYLTITDVRMEDHGTYKCRAQNKFGEKNATGVLSVKERTRITVQPESSTVRADTVVVFECAATTDPDEMENLNIEWRRQGETIDYQNEIRIDKDMDDQSLMIRETIVADTGDYTCIASNGLDSDRVTVTLTVQDKPDPPRNVEFMDCGQTRAVISWSPGESNNAETSHFIPYYHTSFDDPGFYHELDEVAASTTTASISLSPWTNYTFHVRARNDIGLSEPSADTSVCPTDSDIPYVSPGNVCTDLRSPSELVVTWERMEKMDHNGEGFRYNVGYRPNTPGTDFETQTVRDWTQEELVIDLGGDAEDSPFKEYEIYVQAENNEGVAPENRQQIFIGNSGESAPAVAPDNFMVDEESINATSATFLFDRIEETPENVRGHFRGYRVIFWKEGQEDDQRHHDVILGDRYTCEESRVGINPRARGRRQAGDEIEAHVNELWPASTIVAGVATLNNGQTGELSATISFETPEDVPGIPAMFEVREVGSHHLIVQWSPPLEPNGVLTGYIIGYYPVNSPADAETIGPIPPTQLEQKIRDLDPQTRYRITLWATTAVGRGVPKPLEETTLESGTPDVPGFYDIRSGDNSVNVSWVPTAEGETEKPGSEFYVRYRPKDSDEDWTTATPDGENQWVNITDLTPGETYEIQIVAVNGAGDKSYSETKAITIGPREERLVQTIATAGWFIGMMCAIIFLLLILIIVCLIKRNRGGKYPVYEKEKLRGKNPDREDDEAGFGEYNKTDEPFVKKPEHGSIESETKPLGESDSDSMAEYEETDPSKFNEDGSFIGQYGGKKKPDENQPDATSPSALSTFV